MVPSDDSFISDNEEEFCPLCVEEMDISDKNFKPCPCGYQICQFCYNNIKQNPELNGRCPGCRRLYDDESVEYKTISAEEYRLQQLKREKREREKKQREKEKKETEMANKKHLAGLRVVQKNLVYVTGLNPPCNPEDLHSVLRSEKYFGQYGKISKIVINTKTPTASGSHHHHQNPGLVVYVTFSRKEDALKCINELDGSLCDGRVLRAAHGTTKYCSSYLRGHPCPNPNCMFLHEPGEEADSYTRKDLSTQQGIKMSMMGLGGNSRVSSSSNISNSGQYQVHSATNSQSNYSGDEDSFSHSEDDQDDQQNHPQAQIQPPAQNGTAVAAAANATPTAIAATTASAGPILPASVQWAKAGSTSASNSPSVNNNTPLANSAAFPTLGEIFRDQKSQQKKDLKQKVKSKVSKDNVLLPDDIDIDDDSVLAFIDSTSECLRDLQQRKEKLNVHFSKLFNKSGSVLPLFAFNSTEGLSHDTRLEEETLLARQVIERFFLRPIKNYHLAYQNHPIAQQQTLQNQIQQQQQQRQQPVFQPANLEQLQADQQRKLLEAQVQIQDQQQVGGSVISQQQAQQLLLFQLQQQQQQQSQQGSQINMLRATERGNTSTPPPPGLFAANIPKNQLPQSQLQAQVPASFNGEPSAPVVAPAAGAQSSSSQLLTQLMSGKR